MNQVQIFDAARGRDGGYKVDVSRAERIGRVSSEWFSRPADERCLSLSDLFSAVRDRTERSKTRTVESAAIRVEASRDDPERLGADAARGGCACRANTLELWPARYHGWRAVRLSATTSRAACRHQPSVRLDLTSW